MAGSRFAVFLLITFLFHSFVSSAVAMSEKERQFLLLYFDEEDLVIVSATRSLKSITRVAENVEVVTAADIELMNAHTLADVLNTVNGVQVQFFGASPGSIADVRIQGSRADHVVVLIDGISISSMGGGSPDPSLITAQIIDRVEIIKGPASSVWGSSLGGIVNVITKSAPSSDGIGGLVSGSYGERKTGDFNAALSGKKNNFGYYLFAGRLESDGLRKFNDLWQNSLYAKLSYSLSMNTGLTFTLLYNNDRRTAGDFKIYDFSIYQKSENLLSSLSLNTRLSDELSMNVSVRAASQSGSSIFEDLASGSDSRLWAFDDKKYGGSLKLDWKKGIHNVVFGTDYDFISEDDPDIGKYDEDILAVFVNDTINIGKFALTPGARFDHIEVHDTNLKEDFLSPSLGITYAIGDKTLLRGYVSRGFNLPSTAMLLSADLAFIPNPALELEKVWSYQLGLETGSLKYFWLKISGFRHDIRDAITYRDVDVDLGIWTYANTDKIRRQGVEIEIKTLPFYNFFTLSTGGSYIHTKDLAADERIKDNPEYTFDLGLQYDDKKSIRVLVKGRYIDWNLSSGSEGNDKNLIVDVNVMKNLYKLGTLNIEGFVNGHNLFNGSEYVMPYYKNARRWVEAGLRFKF